MQHYIRMTLTSHYWLNLTWANSSLTSCILHLSSVKWEIFGNSRLHLLLQLSSLAMLLNISSLSIDSLSPFSILVFLAGAIISFYCLVLRPEPFGKHEPDVISGNWPVVSLLPLNQDFSSLIRLVMCHSGLHDMISGSHWRKAWETKTSVSM